ncbi:MAG TPA: glycoside hydrolase family 19 protein [Magnetospirillum sp.]|jgi:putative chitinase|nr:glycoside hydrolase family 19 protein [Magnetospirillum sp.]
MLTREILAAAVPDAPGENVDHFLTALAAACDEFEINTPHRLAAFLANIGVESGNLTRTTENLNYSAKGLLRVFPSHFDADEAQDYDRQPERIANRVYADRMGNGDEDSGDGWSFRGRGLIQLTGKDNYAECGEALGIDLLGQPDYLEGPEGAARSAAWFWSKHGINRYADAGDFDGVCDLINKGHKTKPQGDAIGYDERLTAYRAACRALGV